MRASNRFFTTPVFQARFIARPNRFLVSCAPPGRPPVEAFLPNPGRLRELLLPGATLYVTENADPGAARRTRFTAVAVERDGAPVLLHTHATNAVARRLLERRRIPGLEHAAIVRAEAPVGRSRFDFLLRDAAGELYVEVKSCTLFGNGVAMFPDAVTERGRRHLLELAEMARSGTRTAVVFVVHTPNVRWFMPDFHTDLAFSRTLLDVRDYVRILPVSVTWREDLTLGRGVRLLDIPWEHIDREAQDRGAYLLLLELKETTRVEVGSLGAVPFRKGHYIYVGSAMANLAARMARHLRPHKTRHWHIDYLRPRAAPVEALAVRASARLECDLAHALARVLAPGSRGFGCTDCACATHLFYSSAPPLDRRDVHDVLERFRMRRP